MLAMAWPFGAHQGINGHLYIYGWMGQRTVKVDVLLPDGGRARVSRGEYRTSVTRVILLIRYHTPCDKFRSRSSLNTCGAHSTKWAALERSLSTCGTRRVARRLYSLPVDEKNQLLSQ